MALATEQDGGESSQTADDDFSGAPLVANTVHGYERERTYKVAYWSA